MDVNANEKGNDASPPDIDSMVSEAWGRRSFPIQGQGSRNVVQVVVKRSVLDAICEHGLSRTDVEVCGVLVGNRYQDERGPFIYIEAMIRGEHSDNKVAQVTFTSDTWNYIHNEMDQHFNHQRILGWYHTHPGFGIFLSAMDMFIHENFFNEGDQFALVYDPLKEESGLFVWRDGKAELHQYLVEEDVPVRRCSIGKIRSSTTPHLIAAPHAGDDEMGLRLRRLERQNRRLGWCLVATAAVAIVWPILFAWFDFSAFIGPASSKPEPFQPLPIDLPLPTEPDARDIRDPKSQLAGEAESPVSRHQHTAINPELLNGFQGLPLPPQLEEARVPVTAVEAPRTVDRGTDQVEDGISTPKRTKATSESRRELKGRSDNSTAESWNADE